jgi:galactose mutarotase-like enzyme
MIYKISNKDLTLSICSKGAELISIIKESPTLEYMWDGDNKFWPRHAPNLFPITGKLKEGRYELDGNSYSMPVHGFAKDYEYIVVEKTSEKIVFMLESNNKTKELYPYDFQLYIIYELINNTVYIEYKVINLSTTTLFFSIGAHPGFNCPLFDTESLEDYFLEFEKQETKQVYRHTETGFLSSDPDSFHLINGKLLPLTNDLFKDGVYVLKSPRSNWIALRNKNTNHYVKLTFNDFPYLCLWGRPNAPFICFEPWYGVTDIDGSSYDIKQKEGIMELDKNRCFKCNYSITIN